MITWVMNPHKPDAQQLLSFLAPDRLNQEALEEGLFSYTYRPRPDGTDIPFLSLIRRLALHPLRFQVRGVGEQPLVISGLIECLQVLLFREAGLRAERVEVVKNEAEEQTLTLIPRRKLSDGSYAGIYSSEGEKTILLEDYIGYAPALAPDEAGLETSADPLVWAALPRLKNPMLEVTSVLGQSGRLPVVSAAALIEAKQQLRADLQGEMSRLRAEGVFSFPLRAREEMALRREVGLMREVCQAFGFEEVFLAADAAFAFLKAPFLAPDLPDLGETPAAWLREAMTQVRSGDVPIAVVTGPWAENIASSENIARLQGSALRAYRSLDASSLGASTRQYLAQKALALADLSVRLPVLDSEEVVALREEISRLYFSSPLYQRYSQLEDVEEQFRPWAVKLGPFWFAPESLIDERVVKERVSQGENGLAFSDPLGQSLFPGRVKKGAVEIGGKTLALSNSPNLDDSSLQKSWEKGEYLTPWGQYWLSTRGEVSVYALRSAVPGSALCTSGCPGQCPLLPQGASPDCQSGSCSEERASSRAASRAATSPRKRGRPRKNPVAE